MDVGASARAIHKRGSDKSCKLLPYIHSCWRNRHKDCTILEEEEKEEEEVRSANWKSSTNEWNQQKQSLFKSNILSDRAFSSCFGRLILRVDDTYHPPPVTFPQSFLTKRVYPAFCLHDRIQDCTLRLTFAVEILPLLVFGKAPKPGTGPERRSMCCVRVRAAWRRWPPTV